MTKAYFEKLIKKDISDKTWNLYNNLFEKYLEVARLSDDEESSYKFLNLLNLKSIPLDNDLKERRLEAKRALPKLEKRLKELKARKIDIEQTIKWLEKQESTLTDSYKYEKLRITKEIKKITSEIRRIKNSII